MYSDYSTSGKIDLSLLLYCGHMVCVRLEPKCTFLMIIFYNKLVCATISNASIITMSRKTIWENAPHLHIVIVKQVLIKKKR